MSNCSKCEIQQKLEKKGDKTINSNLSSRLIYSRIEKIENNCGAGKSTKKESISEYDSCIARLEGEGIESEKVVKLCGAMRKNRKKNKKKASIVQNEEYNNMSKEELLIEYENTFRQMTALKYKPLKSIKNLMDLDNVKSEISSLENNLWDIKWKYERQATDDTWEDDLLGVRIKIRNEALGKEAITVQENDNRTPILTLIAGKSKVEKIRLMKEHYPEYSEEFLNEVF